MNHSSSPVLHEFQPFIPGCRTCGLAAMRMVLPPLGKTPPKNLWDIIRGGKNDSSTRNMAQAALLLGLNALITRAARPWDALNHILNTPDVYVILNHRISENSPLGHFSVMTDLTPTHITTHDPQFGPYHKMTFSHFLKLWTPLECIPCEITPRIMLILGKDPGKYYRCPECKKKFPLSLMELTKNYTEKIFCPWCDHGFIRKNRSS